MKRHARITLTVECIRTCLVVLLFDVYIQGRVGSKTHVCFRCYSGAKDPLVYNELGVVHYKLGEYDQAKAHFEHVLKLCKHLSKTLMLTWEATYCNLGECCSIFSHVFLFKV